MPLLVPLVFEKAGSGGRWLVSCLLSVTDRLARNTELLTGRFVSMSTNHNGHGAMMKGYEVVRWADLFLHQVLLVEQGSAQSVNIQGHN